MASTIDLKHIIILYLDGFSSRKIGSTENIFRNRANINKKFFRELNIPLENCSPFIIRVWRHSFFHIPRLMVSGTNNEHMFYFEWSTSPEYLLPHYCI